MSTSALTSRDPNTSAPSPKKPTNTSFLNDDKKPIPEEPSKPQNMEYHRRILQSKLQDD
ncbi:MAG: hypothetical protein Q9190_007610, partial [Brigantiaea leucoxantha]